MIGRLHAAALVLPLGFAVAVLASSAANRGDARGPTTLSEREVVIGFRSDDRSLAELWLSWSEPAGPGGAWLTRDTLGALGFDVSVDPEAADAEVHYRRQLTRRAYVAFELDGPAWQAVLAERLRNEAPGGPFSPGDPRAGGSRLVPVAVAREAAALVARYPDPQRHLIARAIVAAHRYDPPGGRPYVGGALVNVDPRRITVPVERASDLPERQFDEPLPAFRISLMYGRRWEPWLVSISRGDASR